MKNKKVLWVTQTVLLIALAVLAQLLSKYIPALKIGPFKLNELVTDTVINFVLIMAAFLPGLTSAVIVALASPVLAALLGAMPCNTPKMVPVFMVGNIAIVFITWLCFRASHGLGNVSAKALNFIGIVAGALLKALAMWAVTVKIIAPLFNMSKGVKAALAAAVTKPQFITGVAGGIIALLIMPVVKRLTKKRR